MNYLLMQLKRMHTKKNELSVDKIIARLQTHGYDIDQNMIKQRRNKRSIDETPSNEIDFWNDTMETTSINEHEILLIETHINAFVSVKKSFFHEKV